MHQSFFIGNRLSHRADLFKKVSTDASRRRDGLRRYSSSSDLGRQSPVPKIDSKTNRRKMGPPQRKFGYQPPLEQTPTVGRVSVYCVGSALDLEALRVHVFRKGFGGDENKNDFHLSKGAEDQDVIDDEVLHVTNGPSSFEKSRQDDGEEGTGSSVLENSDEVSWKTKVMVGMATQDIFYFEYGCVVFWGLSLAEEKAAISELMQFTIDPVTSEQLEDR